MKTSWEAHELRSEFGDDCSLAMLIGRLEEKVAQTGNVICKIQVNDIFLSEEDEARLAMTKVNEITKLNIEVGIPDKLLISLIGDWIRMMPELISEVDRLASVIRFEGIEGHYKSFTDLIDVLRHLVTSLEQIRKFLGKYNLLDQTQKWLKDEEFLGHVTKSIVDHFVKKDFVQLADDMEYDLNTSLVSWQKNLEDYLMALSQS